MNTNYFGNTDVHLPTKYQEYFHRYCLTRAEGSKNSPEDSPFPRMVDMWFTAVCLAIYEKLKPSLEDSGPTYKAIEGAVFGSDPWRSGALALIAVAYTGKTDVVANPNEMIRIANGYALAGLPQLIRLLEDRGGDTALDHLSEEIESKLR